MSELEAIVWQKEQMIGPFLVSLGTTDSGTEWVHIDNKNTKRNSVFMSLDEFKEISELIGGEGE